MDPPVQVLKTERLLLRHLGPDDAPFILRLLNEPSWIANIGDRGVRTIADAQRYLDKGPIEMYGRLGFGLYLVCLAGNEVPIGLCGLLKRETLDDVDLGFAFLPDYWGRGYAHESSAAVLSYARNTLSLARIVAITTFGNDSSRKLLERLGFSLERSIRLEPDVEALLLYAKAV